MKSQLPIWVVLSITASVCFSGCKKDDATPAQTNTATVTNSITGNTSAFDYNFKDSTILKDIQVMVLGNNGATVAQGTTDATGFFKIDNVAIGTYDLCFTRPGYDTLTYYSFYHGAGPLPSIYAIDDYSNELYRKVASSITAVSVLSNGSATTGYGKVQITTNQLSGENTDNLLVGSYYRPAGSTQPFQVSILGASQKTKIAADKFEVTLVNYGFSGSATKDYEIYFVLHSSRSTQYLTRQFIRSNQSPYWGPPSPTFIYTSP